MADCRAVAGVRKGRRARCVSDTENENGTIVGHRGAIAGMIVIPGQLDRYDGDVAISADLDGGSVI